MYKRAPKLVRGNTVTAHPGSRCTLRETHDIIRLDRRFSETDVESLWMMLCYFITGGGRLPELSYGDILRVAHDNASMALISEVHKQALKRLTSLLEGRLPDEFGQPKLTLDHFKSYLDNVGRSMNATNLWCAIVEAAYGIFIRNDMGPEQYGIPYSFIHRLTQVAPGTYRHIGTTTQEVLQGWVESMSV